jgi:5-methylcytosine-specific restriction endonuclease McrA
MPSRTGRRWQQRKRRIIRRDGGICWICGQPDADSADHVIAHANGGRDTDDNLRAVHHDVPPRCNRVKGAGTVDQARQRLRLDQTDDWTW